MLINRSIYLFHRSIDVGGNTLLVHPSAWIWGGGGGGYFINAPSAWLGWGGWGGSALVMEVKM